MKDIVMYSLGTNDFVCHKSSLIHLKQPCHAKICNLRIELAIQENITGFEITMNDS